MAYRLAHTYRDQLLHVHNVGWSYWDGKRWTPDDIGAAKRAVLDVLRTALADSIGKKELQRDIRKCESDSGVHGVLGIAAALIPFAATVRDLDADPYLLNTASGTLDLRTMKQHPHDPADRITKVTRAAYDPDAAGVAWNAFLQRVLPDESVREYLQRITGIALLGKVIEHVLAILIGKGRNGKSTFYEAVCHALGDYAHTADPELFMLRHNTHPVGEMDLLGRRLIVVSESREDRQLDEAKVKRLTGGDPINARYMHKNPVVFTPSHLPLLITNHLPKVSDDSVAIWSRLRVIPFTVFIPEEEQDTDLGDTLQAEADAVLAWSLAGWIEYQKRRLDAPPAVVQATDSYHKDSDAVAQFIEEECHLSNQVKVTAGELFDAWERWRKIDGSPEISKKALGQALDRHGFTSSDSNGKRWWDGLCVLRSEEQ